MNLKTTPLLDEHKLLDAKMAPFGGWNMPIQYEGIIAEHNWTRTMASVFDICHMGEFMVTGDAVKSGLENILTAKLSDMPVGLCRYGFMLDEDGGIIDDVITYRLEKDKWMLVVNASTTDGDEAHLRKNLYASAGLKNISEITAKIDLQGPASREALKKICGPGIDKLKYYTFGFFEIMGEKNIVSRTGYTGELGYELYVNAAHAKNLWKKLLCDDSIKPAGLGARDTLRLEMCYPLYGQDIDINTDPVEAGLGRFVAMDKEFIGKRALAEKDPSDLGRKLVAFAADSRRSPRHNYKILAGGKDAGAVTSGSFSPSLGCGIGMGYVNEEDAKPGQALSLREGNLEINAKIVDKPFYKMGTARS